MRRFYVLQDGSIVGDENQPYRTKLAAQRAAHAHRMMLRQFVDAGWMTRQEYADIEVEVGRVDIQEGPEVSRAARITYSDGSETPTTHNRCRPG